MLGNVSLVSVLCRNVLFTVTACQVVRTAYNSGTSGGVVRRFDCRCFSFHQIVAFLKAITKGGIKLEEPRQKRSIPVASYQPPSEDVLSVEQAASKQ